MCQEMTKMEKVFEQIATQEQKGFLHMRYFELMAIGCELVELELSERWVNIFTKMAFYRNWSNSDDILQKKNIFEAIGSINSDAVYLLAKYKGKTIELKTLHTLCVEISNELVRKRAVKLIMKRRGNLSSQELASIIFSAKRA